MQAQATQPVGVRWWPPVPAFTRRPAAPQKRPETLADDFEFGDDLRSLFDGGAAEEDAAVEDVDQQRLPKSGEDWLDSVEKNAFWQAVDAIRAHAAWRPKPSYVDMFGNVVRDINPRLATELAWIFGAEGGEALPFEAAADAVSVNPARFRRICQRAFPEECAWIEANVGPLQGV